MKSFRNVAVLLVAVAMACGFAFPGSHPMTNSKGGLPTIRWSDEGVEDVTLDPPAINQGSAALAVQEMIFNGLVGLNSHLQVVPDGASSWTVSRDHRVYTFHVRRGLRFGDGSPVTAYDFAWSLNRAFEPRFLDGNTDYYLGHIVGGLDVTNGRAQTVRGIRVLNKHTLRITTDVPTAAFLDQLTYEGASVVPRHAIERYGSAWTNHAYGTGPFVVSGIVPGQYIDLSPNRYYWCGRPKVKIQVDLIPDVDVAYSDYMHHLVDVMGGQEFPADRVAQVRTRHDVHSSPQLVTEYVLPNERQKPFDNSYVRRAFALAFDRSALVRVVFDGDRYPAHGILPPGLPGYDPQLKGQRFDPALAQRYLAQAGYKDGKGFPEIALTIDASATYGAAEAAFLTHAWKKYLDVEVTVHTLDHAEYDSALTALNFQLAFVRWTDDYPDPQNFLSIQLQTGATDNIGGFSSHQFDALTSRADSLFGNNRLRYGLYRSAEAIALKQAAWIVIDWGKTVCLINRKIHGLLVNDLSIVAPNWAAVTESK